MKKSICFAFLITCFSLAGAQSKVRGCAMLKTPECEKALEQKKKEDKKSSLTAQKGVVFDSGEIKVGDQSSYESSPKHSQKKQ